MHTFAEFLNQIANVFWGKLTFSVRSGAKVYTFCRYTNYVVRKMPQNQYICTSMLKSASVEPRTSASKFARSPCTDPPGYSCFPPKKSLFCLALVSRLFRFRRRTHGHLIRQVKGGCTQLLEKAEQNIVTRKYLCRYRRKRTSARSTEQ